MLKFIKKWLLRKELTKIKKGSVVEAALDDYISEAMKEHSSASRMADKILKAKILHQQTRQTLSKIKDLDATEYDDEDDEEIEEAPSMENKLLEIFMGKLGGGDKKPEATLDEFGEPRQSAQSAPLVEAVKKLSKPDIEELKRKFLE